MTGRRVAALVLFDLVAVAVIAALVALSVWQFQRRTWKLDLIARIEARVNAPAVPAPGADRWTGISAAADEYRRVEATGRWLDDRAALVQAVTEHGGGYWVLAPFRRDDGTIVYVNRGFVPADKRDPASWRALAPQTETVTGLLRLTEPRGTVLQSNDPAADRWYSRDVEAVARSRGLGTVAPYFIDAERKPGEEGIPIAGLTVLKFTNNHLVYALTWAALAIMAAAGAIFVHVDVLRRHRKPA